MSFELLLASLGLVVCGLVFIVSWRTWSQAPPTVSPIVNPRLWDQLHTDDVSYRMMTERDLPGFFDLHKQRAFAEENRWSQKEIDQFVEQFDDATLREDYSKVTLLAIDRQSEEVLGAAELSRSESGVLTIGLVVTENRTGAGIGTRLMAGMTSFLYRADEPAFVMTAPTNATVINIMAKLGFTANEGTTSFVFPDGTVIDALAFPCGGGTSLPDVTCLSQ